MIKLKLIGYENIHASLFTFVFLSFPHFMHLKMCVTCILTHVCVLRIYTEILENLMSLINTLCSLPQYT